MWFISGIFFPLNKLAQNSYDVVVQHLLFLLPQWCLILPPWSEAMRHKEMKIQLKHFLTNVWENLQKEFSLQAQALVASLSLMPLPQHDPLVHKHFHHNLILGCAREYFETTHGLAPFSPISTSSNTTSTFIALHLKWNGYFSFFLKDYKWNQYFKKNSKSFKLAFQHMPHMSISSLSKIFLNIFKIIFT